MSVACEVGANGVGEGLQPRLMLGLLAGRLARGVEIVEVGDRDRNWRRFHVFALRRRQGEEHGKAKRETRGLAQRCGSAPGRLVAGHGFLPMIA